MKQLAESTHDIAQMRVNICVGYGGRQELTDAMRSLLLDQASKGRTLEDVAQTLEVDQIAEHLYTRGQPDPDLVIRTSGEQRLSGFLLWQSVHSEFYFSDALWPSFRHVDFLRAMRSYAARERRFGA
jgi:short-chain Z-isoprenyl diphosphate synthase